jgi:hypothetical protein
MMTTSPMRRTKVPKTSDLRVLRSASSASVRAISIDSAASLAYLNRNRTPHASASVSAPGGSFFARSTGEAGFQ